MLECTIITGKLTKRGQLYSILFNGEEIVSNKLASFHPACRALVEKGFSGPAIFVDRQGKPRFRFDDIESAAKYQLHERPSGPTTFTLSKFTGETDNEPIQD